MHSNRIFLTLWLIGTVCFHAFSQIPALEGYVEEGLKTNLALQQQKINL